MDLLIRDVTFKDSEALLEWRNQAEVRMFSRNQGLISKETQFVVLTENLKLIASSSNDKESIKKLVKELKTNGLNKANIHKLPYVIKQDNIIYP